MVALFLRGAPIATDPTHTFIHTHLSTALKCSVLECESLRPLILARMMGQASLYSHPSADVKKGSEEFAENYKQVLDCLPYMRQTSVAHESDMAKERQTALERYRKWRDAQKKD